MSKKIECFKEMSCTLKLAYVLIIISLVLNVVVFAKLCCKKGAGKMGGKATGDVAEWVKNNPEVILESVNTYVMKQQETAQAEQMAKASQNIGKYEKDLQDGKTAGVINPKGKQIIVEFYDYNCGYCKMASKNVDELLKTRNDVKVILRSIPILGEPSVYASEVEAAIMLIDANKVAGYHKTLMAGSARSKDQVNKAAQDAGINLNTLTRTLESKKAEINKIIENNMKLASEIGVSGTPAFVINGQLIPGAVDAAALNGMLK